MLSFVTLQGTGNFYTCLRIIITTIHFRKSKNTNCNKHIEEYDLGFESEQDNHVGLVSIQDEKCNRLY